MVSLVPFQISTPRDGCSRGPIAATCSISATSSGTPTARSSEFRRNARCSRPASFRRRVRLIWQKELSLFAGSRSAQIGPHPEPRCLPNSIAPFAAVPPATSSERLLAPRTESYPHHHSTPMPHVGPPGYRQGLGLPQIWPQWSPLTIPAADRRFAGAQSKYSRRSPLRRLA